MKRDENLIDIETDKVVLELPAPQSGVLTELVKVEGALVAANEVIARIDTSAVDERQDQANTIAVGEKEGGKTDASPIDVSLVLMPAAKKLAADKSIEVNKITGTGRGGRITKEDVIAASSAKKEKPQSSAVQAETKDVDAKGRSEQRVPMSRLRQRVAERLLQSQATAAILTTFNEVNMQPVIDIRNRYKVQFEKEHGVKLGFMSFFVKAVIAALKKYPIIIISWIGSINNAIYF